MDTSELNPQIGTPYLKLEGDTLGCLIHTEMEK